MKANELLKTSPNVAWRKIEDQVVILDLQTSHYYSLNNVGSRIWELLQEGQAEDSVIAAIEAEYEIDGKIARRDFTAFLAQLKRQKITLPE